MLYDVISAYLEGRCCPLAHHGHSHGDRPQLVIGLLCVVDGCPVAVEVFDGNTADPTTVAAQITRLKQRFRLHHVVMVGDRAMLTNARIVQTLRPRLPGLDHPAPGPSNQAVGGRRAPAVLPFQQQLYGRDKQPGLSGELPMVCKNPLLAEERARKRDKLLALTEADLAKIQARVRLERNPLRGAAEIGKAVGAVMGTQKMAKHFDLAITDDAFGFTRKTEAIIEEARFDGFYVPRTSVPAEQIDTAGTVRAYKSFGQGGARVPLPQDRPSRTAAGVPLDGAAGARACSAVQVGALPGMAPAPAVSAAVVRRP